MSSSCTQHLCTLQPPAFMCSCNMRLSGCPPPPTTAHPSHGRQPACHRFHDTCLKNIGVKGRASAPARAWTPSGPGRCPARTAPCRSARGPAATPPCRRRLLAGPLPRPGMMRTAQSPLRLGRHTMIPLLVADDVVQVPDVSLTRTAAKIELLS